jgi:N6-L-threonylcarbamoyladenine synthase
MHTEWITTVVEEALTQAGIKPSGIQAVSATEEPGLLGSLLVGLTFAKTYAWTAKIPFIPVNHLLAHLYAPRLTEAGPPYPYLGLVVSGGHTLICRVNSFDRIEIIGTTIDDAVGEAFDKIGKYYRLPYPAGKFIDEIAKTGDDHAYNFPYPNLYKRSTRCDVSYSGLKNAVINQRETFRKKGERGDLIVEDIMASFQRIAVAILLRSIKRAVEETGLKTLVAGGGVAANSLLRAKLREMSETNELNCIFPPLHLCGDNGAMVAGLAYNYFLQGRKI